MAGSGLMSRFLSLRARRPRPLPAREAYALWADTYPPAPHNPLMEAEQAMVARMVTGIVARRALDVGTGLGRNLPLLSSSGARIVVGVDFSMAMLKSPLRNPRAGRRVCADGRRLPFPSAVFDLVCSSLMAGDIPDLGEWITELARVLSTGGHLIYSDFHPSWATSNWRRTFRAGDGRSYEVAHFPHTLAEHLAKLAERGFEVRAIREPRITPPPDARTAAQATLGTAHDTDGRAPAVVVFHVVKRGVEAAW